jgi:hypothetical protein
MNFTEITSLAMTWGFFMPRSSIGCGSSLRPEGPWNESWTDVGPQSRPGIATVTKGHTERPSGGSYRTCTRFTHRSAYSCEFAASRVGMVRRGASGEVGR